ncbi:MAG: pro-sigmaK processing inhibitor BofA family protein [Oscillospiraceae bacterium]|jgi:inhibitor of the pro-sigma K processing machinery|nr:pro-sigmaK processing inhibitor BofA family protein [Oscillospiraceae bacterium]
MDMMALIFLVLGGLAAAALGARAAAAREGFLPAAVNALLGLAALLAVNLTSKYTGLHLGFNLFNGLTAGILGVPGVVLLLLVQWVIT